MTIGEVSGDETAIVGCILNKFRVTKFICMKTSSYCRLEDIHKMLFK